MAADDEEDEGLNMKVDQLRATDEKNLSEYQPRVLSHNDKLMSTMVGKYHRAAIDGYVDMLCDASKRDTNLAAEGSLITPTLVATQCGNLEALRILVGRGGDPERTNRDGWSALHLAAAYNHLNCVSFLVNFGVNMWSLDNELHTAKDLAAIREHKSVLDYLDQMMAKQSALNTKSVQKLKEKAKWAAEKRLKVARKAQLKAIKQVEKDERYLIKLSANRRLIKSAHSISDIKLVGRKESINFSPRSDASIGSFLSCSPGSTSRLAASSQTASEAATLSSRLSHSSSISNLMLATNGNIRNEPTNRLKLDLLSASRQWRKQQHTELTNMKLNSRRDHHHHTCSTSSSSSVSTSSGYTSASSASYQLAQSASERPKYSDLVALGRERVLDSLAKEYKHSFKSNSTSGGSKLRAASGVSRKMHLKRLLLNNKASSPTTTTSSATSSSVPSNRVEYDRVNLFGQLGAGQTRLCNVQPIIKLKLGAQRVEEAHSTSRLSRTISEPDFGLAMRAESESELDNGVQNEHHPAEESEPKQKQLLSQCLSQLKLQQLDSNNNLSGSISNNNIESQAKPRTGSKETGVQIARPPTGHSDELLQHQLNAGDSPLKPSIIKQHRQLAGGSVGLVGQVAAGSSSGASDSIGSAGSLAQRACSSSGSSSGLLTCSLESGSSPFERLCGEMAGHLPPPPPPPPLPANAFKSATMASSQDTLEGFLAASGLGDQAPVFALERIDLEALLLLTDDDLKSLGLLLGPRRKLLNAIERRKKGALSQAMYVSVVDTPL